LILEYDKGRTIPKAAWWGVCAKSKQEDQASQEGGFFWKEKDGDHKRNMLPHQKIPTPKVWRCLGEGLKESNARGHSKGGRSNLGRKIEAKKKKKGPIVLMV